jgi:hypothetical protein
VSPARSSELLGYAPDARVLIVNADDLGMHQGINLAIVDSIEREGIVVTDYRPLQRVWSRTAPTFPGPGRRCG